MNPKPKNFFARYKKVFIGIILIIVALPLASALFTSLNSARFASDSIANLPGVPTNKESARSMQADIFTGSEVVLAVPTIPDAYVSDLELYETTDYSVTGRLRNLDVVCENLIGLKTEEGVHFKSFRENSNQCSASFFVDDEQRAAEISKEFSGIKGIEVTRFTQSVTRARSNLKSRSVILQAQFDSVTKTLAEAELQYADIAEVARSNNDAAALTEVIRDKLTIIEDLTQRSIQLSNQLQQIEKQAADLDERVGVTAFTVQLSRSFIIDNNRTAREWEGAWKLLREQFTAVLIGLTAYFGVFLLRLVQFALYGVILLVVARLFWKLKDKIWKV